MDPEDEDFLDDEAFENGDDDADFDDAGDNAGDDEGGIDPSLRGYDAGTGREGDEGEPPVRQPSRATRAVLAAKQEAREAKERAEAIERELQNFRNQQQSVGAAEREAAALANMDPLERIEYQLRKTEQASEHRIAALRNEMAEANDKAAFAARCAADARLAKIAPEVEAALAQSRANGMVVPRETVAAYLLGQKILNGASGARKSQARRAAESVQRQRARPTSGGSDVAQGRGNDRSGDYRKRLENMQI